MSDPSIPGGKKLCPSCTTYVGVNDSVCGNCGYNFETGENPAEGPGSAGSPTEPLTVYSESSGPPRIAGQGAGRAIAVGVLVVILAVAGVIVFVAKGVFDATEDVRQQFPDFGNFTPGGDLDFSPGDFGAGTNQATDFDSCVKLMNKYLKKVLANDGQPADLPTILQDAATEMGVGSPEFSDFTTIYTGTAGTAVTDGTKAALKEAKKDAKAACRRRYG